jgi:signal transduction histidine kinase
VEERQAVSESLAVTHGYDRDALTQQVDLLRGYSRMRLLLDLSVKLNTAFLRAQDLDEIIQAVLVGVTAGEGLGFNRAFLIRLDPEGRCLEGAMAVGPSDATEAHRIWAEISQNNLSLFEILDGIRVGFHDETQPLNQLARKIVVPLQAGDHPLVRAMNERRPVWVGGGGVDGPIPAGLKELLRVDEFVAVPLATDEEDFGIILADNFVSRTPINQEDLDALRLFAGLASIAVGKTRMCERLDERICQLRGLNEEVESNKDLLVEVERYAAMGRMADQLLHEIRNPLSILGGMARILKRRLKESELCGYADVIVQQSERLEQTLAGLFTFVHSPTLDRAPVKLYHLIRVALALVRSDLNKQGIECHINLPEPEPELSLDHIRVQQAFLNILKNAVEAMPSGGLLTVSVACLDTFIEMQVADTGLGIAKGHLSRADEPFFTTKSRGIGLGLSTAKQIFALHGGTLSLTRNRLGGTTVIITLPTA